MLDLSSKHFLLNANDLDFLRKFYTNKIRDLHRLVFSFKDTAYAHKILNYGVNLSHRSVFPVDRSATTCLVVNTVIQCRINNGLQYKCTVGFCGTFYFIRYRFNTFSFTFRVQAIRNYYTNTLSQALNVACTCN